MQGVILFLLIFCSGLAAAPLTSGLTIEIGVADDIAAIPITVKTVQLRIRPNKYGWANSLLLTDKKLAQLRSLGMVAIISVDGFPENAEYIHSSPLFWSNSNDLAEVVRFASEISARYSSNANVVAYQFMSEPVNLEGGAHYPPENDQLILDVINAIRRNSTRVQIIVAQSVWGECSGQRIIDRKGIVYGCHYYSPHFMTHQGIDPYPNNIPWPTDLNGVIWDQNKLIQTLEELRKFKIDNNVDVFVGEFSCVRWGVNCDAYLNELTAIFDTYQWTYMYFQLNGWNGWNPYYSDTLSPNPEDDYVGYGSKRWGVLTTIYGP